MHVKSMSEKSEARIDSRETEGDLMRILNWYIEWKPHLHHLQLEQVCPDIPWEALGLRYDPLLEEFKN